MTQNAKHNKFLNIIVQVFSVFVCLYRFHKIPSLGKETCESDTKKTNTEKTFAPHQEQNLSSPCLQCNDLSNGPLRTLHRTRFQAHQHSTRHVMSTCCLIVVYIDVFQLQIGITMVNYQSDLYRARPGSFPRIWRQSGCRIAFLECERIYACLSLSKHPMCQNSV